VTGSVPRRHTRRPLRVPPPYRSRRLSPRLVSLVVRAASLVAGWPDGERLALASVLIVVGLVLTAGGALADVSLHRGVETGGEAVWVRHPSGRDLATNVDLTRFAPDQLDEVVTALQSAGFRYVRQSFSWAEIEPERGTFSWQRYDAIVATLAKHSVTPVAVLHRSPGWARAPTEVDAFDAPPVNVNDYERFVREVVGRYGNRVPFVQLWDLPNRPDHWGGAAPDPAAYVRILGIGSNAARTAGPNTTIVLAELDPRPTSRPIDDDLAFLRAVYQNDGAPFFHVVAARVEGGQRSPFDRRIDQDSVSVSRAILFREVIIEEGDAAKPVWATHYGWTVGAGPDSVDADHQAAFSIAGIERSRSEWPWMGPTFAWGLVPGEDLGGGVDPGMSLLQSNGGATPFFAALEKFDGSQQTDAAPTGFLPVNARQFVYEGNWEDQHLGTTTYRTTREVGARTTVRFAGTGLVALLRLSPEAGTVNAVLDGKRIDVSLQSLQAQDLEVSLASGLNDGIHNLTLTLAEPGQLTIGGLEIERTVPLRWPIMLLVIGGLALLFLGLRDLLYTIAERTGRLRRRGGTDLWPELPQLPDWRPARRA
jgi:hypothetical protein